MYGSDFGSYTLSVGVPDVITLQFNILSGKFRWNGAFVYTDANANAFVADTCGILIDRSSASAASNVTGGSAGDVLIGGSAADALDGADGNDSLSGGTGNDTITGGTGNDTITGGAGTDSLAGGSGNDTFLYTSAELIASEVVDGGANTDTIAITNNTNLADTVWANKSNLEALDLQGTGTQVVTLGSNANSAFSSGITVTTAAAATYLWLYGGSLTVALTATGTNNNDTIFGGAGSDSLSGGNGNDTLNGGAGNDTLLGIDGNDTLSGGDGDDSLVGGSGNDITGDTLSGDDGNDTLVGGNGTDSISGGDGNDSISGGGGDDTLSGDAGNDSIVGGAGDNTLSGGDGNDTLSGGDGNDTLTGGAGSDFFSGSVDEFNGDTITDFSTADTLRVTGTNLSALNGTAAGSTLTLATSKTLTLTGVSSAYNWQATFTGGDDGYTALTLVAATTTTTTTTSGGGGDSGGPSTSMVDGVSVSSTSSTDGRGVSQTSLSIPVVSAARQDSNATTSNADVPLATNQQGLPAIQASLPTGTGLNASGLDRPVVKTLAVDTLLQAIQATTTSSSTDRTQQTGFGQSFLNALPTDAPLLVQTITPTVAGTTAPSQPIVLTGDTTLSGAPGNYKALVVDGRNLPTGTSVDLLGVDFAAVQGALTVNTHHTTAAASNRAAFLTVADTAQSIVCDSAAQKVTLGDAADMLQAGGGDDTGIGGSGADTITMGDGADLVCGNMGNDLLLGNMGADTLFGGRGDDSLFGGKDADTLFGNDDADRLEGDDGADLLLGNAGTDVLLGNMGADTLFGGIGNDTLFGGRDDDRLWGDDGDDLLWGDAGADTLTGGVGGDEFAFAANSGHDVIADFSASDGDRIGLAAGATYTVRSSGAGDAVIVLSTDDDVTLKGITAAQVNAAWFVTV
ncbi:hypothetical protein [Azospirillum sp. sgz301742]